jgi:gluconolactonase
VNSFDRLQAVGLDRFRVFAEGLDHPEGVVWGLDGFVYAGGEAGQIYRVSLQGAVEEVANTGGFILGLALDGEGLLYGCDLDRHEVVRINLETGTVDTYSSGTQEFPMRTPNYPAFDERGNLYVTDSGAWHANDGLIFKVAPGGQTEVWTREAHRFPNGCCVSIEGDALLVNESTLPGLSRVEIRADGSAGPLQRVAELPYVPDGVQLAEDGSILVSCYRPDRIYRIPPGGEPEVLAEDPEGTLIAAPTNVAFGGPDLDRLFVASLARWHLAVGDVGLRGARLRYPKIA